MARIQPVQIKNILKSAIIKAQAQQQATQQLERAWREAAGEEAAKHSFPQQITNKTLTVTVDSSVWIYYLHNRRQHIEQQLRKQLSTQYNIKIRLRAGE